MTPLMIYLNASIFIILSGIHVYWILGGKWGTQAAIPTSSNGKNLFSPGIFATLIVACALFMFSIVTIGNLGIFDHQLSRIFFRYGNGAIALLFGIRAIGDFHYVGFFKSIKNTVFAYHDTKYFSPLCLLVGTISILIALLS